MRNDTQPLKELLINSITFVKCDNASEIMSHHIIVLNHILMGIKFADKQNTCIVN